MKTLICMKFLTILIFKKKTFYTNSLSPEARACSLAHIAHSIFPIAFTGTNPLQTAVILRVRLTTLL